MNTSIEFLSFPHLALMLIPVGVVVFLLYRWSLNGRHLLYAFCRMFFQLLTVGYFLTTLFSSDQACMVLLVLTIMLFASSWIALDSISEHRRSHYKKAVLSLLVGGGVSLLFVTRGVLSLYPWYEARVMIPLAGMIFSGSMNSLSLAAERLTSEMRRGVAYEEARNIAFQASLIPITNSLLAAGLVAIPGMMTGQILSGVSPLIAVRYQIMVMAMILGASGISSACFIHWMKEDR